MRYRPFGVSGAAVSNLTLCLGAAAAARGGAHVRDMIFAALEAGINAYHFDIADPALLLFALIAAYFYLGWKVVGGTLWQRILGAR